MILSLKGFTRIVEDAAAAVQASCASLIDMSSGSVLRAVMQAYAGVALWLQYLIVEVWRGCRLATSSGPDVDSFVGDFELTRLPAVAASGQVMFARFAAVQSALVPLGLTVTTADASLSFTVALDSTNPAWNVQLGGYLMPAGVSSVTVPVVAAQPGAAYNVAQGAISLIAKATPGIDTVTNPGPFTDGVDGEADASLKARFQVYINTRSRATPLAVEYAISSVQQGLSYALAENQDATGAYRPGNFVVTVDNGTGHPPPALIAQVQAAVEAVRPIGSTFTVLAPTVVLASVSLSVTVDATGTKSAVVGKISDAIKAYLQTLPIGAPLPYSRIAQLAWAADPSITNVTSILLNGDTKDLVVAPNAVIEPSIITIN